MAWNPLIILFGITYGNNDILMSAFLLFSLLAMVIKKNILSGIFIGLAISVKFVPVLFIPVLMLACNSRRKAIMFFLSAVLAAGVCCLLAFLFMGYSPFDAILFGASRSSKMLSIFRVFADLNLDFLSTPLVILSVLAGTIMGHIRKWNWNYTFCLVYLLTITFYKVGHHQYYIPLFSWMIYILFRDSNLISSMVKITFGVLFLWINFLAFIYPFTDNYRNEYIWIRDWVGFPTFLFQLFLIASLIIFMEKNRITVAHQ